MYLVLLISLIELIDSGKADMIWGLDKSVKLSRENVKDIDLLFYSLWWMEGFCSIFGLVGFSYKSFNYLTAYWRYFSVYS